jgi:hypothetical protein
MIATLQKMQNAALRIVPGAFKDTLIPDLHAEANVVPIDLWFAQIQASMRVKTQQTEHVNIVQRITRKIWHSTRSRRGRPRDDPPPIPMEAKIK